MKIVIAGGTGFLGSPLSETWAEEGHDVQVLTRSLQPGESRHDPGTGMPGITRLGWIPDGTTGPWSRAIEGADAVVNLAGENLGDKRWTPQRKAQLRDSRVLPTRSLAAAIVASSSPPPVFVSASAVGYYGASGDQPKPEDAPAGRDFLANLCEDWEREALRVERPGTRVLVLRSGVVLDREGALSRMAMPFRFLLGGPLGSGRQYLSWIHRRDWVEMVRWLVEEDEIAGPVNATAPEPVTNAEFSRALGRALHRPALIPAPAFAIRLLLGEMADMVLTGQRAVPARVQNGGFHFRFPEIDIALRGIFQND
jgi:uncharacterized protein (TIGR01777 family)